MKIRTAEELQEILDDDYAWRRKELTAIYTNVQSSKPLLLKTNIRIGVVMLYAHWEGFIKSAAESYLIYVACKKLTYAELSNNFVALSLKLKLNEFQNTNKNTIHTQIVDFLRGDLNNRAQVPSENIIKTQSNLNSEILKEILSVVGVNYSNYELKQNYIDAQLLNIRNTVAHGQDIEMDSKEYMELYNEITTLIANFKTDIINCAITYSFKKV